MTDIRLRITLPARLTDPVGRAAAAAGQEPTTWITDLLSNHLGLTDSDPDRAVPLRCPEPVVIVRLAPRPPGESRAGWRPDMSPEEWWHSASRWWRLAPKTRDQYRCLAAADPYGVVQRVWRVSGWDPDPDGGPRFAACDGVEITNSSDPVDQAMLGCLLGRSVPTSRNPVTLR